MDYGTGNDEDEMNDEEDTDEDSDGIYAAYEAENILTERFEHKKINKKCFFHKELNGYFNGYFALEHFQYPVMCYLTVNLTDEQDAISCVSLMYEKEISSGPGRPYDEDAYLSEDDLEYITGVIDAVTENGSAKKAAEMIGICLTKPKKDRSGKQADPEPESNNTKSDEPINDTVKSKKDTDNMLEMLNSFIDDTYIAKGYYVPDFLFSWRDNKFPIGDELALKIFDSYRKSSFSRQDAYSIFILKLTEQMESAAIKTECLRYLASMDTHISTRSPLCIGVIISAQGLLEKNEK